MAKTKSTPTTAAERNDQLIDELAQTLEEQGGAPESKPAARGIVQAVRSPKASAGRCPKVAHHVSTRVYATKGQVRYCVCDDCPEQTTWKVTAEYADEDRQWLAELAEALAAAEAVDADGSRVVVLEAGLRDELVARLRAIAKR